MKNSTLAALCVGAALAFVYRGHTGFAAASMAIAAMAMIWRDYERVARHVTPHPARPAATAPTKRDTRQRLAAMVERAPERMLAKDFARMLEAGVKVQGAAR